MRPQRKRLKVADLPQKKRRTQEQRYTDTRRKLIEAAIQLLHESGFAHLTVRKVASRAGLTSGAMQHHFRSSEELMRGVIETVFPMLQIDVCHSNILALAAPERVSQVVDMYWQKLYGHPDYLIIWELMFGTREHDNLQQLQKALQKKFVAKGVEDLTRIFADLGMHPQTAFRLFTFIGSQLRGLALLSMFEGQRVLQDDLRLLKEATVQLIARHATFHP